MELNKDQWTRFVNILTGIAAAGFDDCIINNGRIRESDVTKTLVVDLQLDVPLQMEVQIIKSFLPLYKSFIPLDENGKINIETTDDTISIKDDLSFINIRRPVEKSLSCKFLPDDIFQQFGFDTKESKLSVKINEYLLSRIKAIRDNFQTTVFNVESIKNKATLFFKSYSNTRTAKMITMDTDLPDVKLSIACSVFDFPFDSDFTMDILETEKNKFIAKFSGTISGIASSLYANAKLE
jgi:hypothetical protein